MSHPWDEIWPVPEAPPEFALQVLVACAKRPTSRWRKPAWLLAALVPCVALGAGTIALRQHQEEAVRRAVILETQRKETEERLRRLQAEFESSNRREQELVASLANAKDEAARVKLRAELEAQKTSTATAKGVVRSGKRKHAASCSPGDPLCDP